MVMNMIVAVFAFTAFISEHPAFIAWLLGGLVTLIAAMVGGYWGYLGSRLNKLEEVDNDLVARVEATERTLEAYKEHVGAGDKALRDMSERVTLHMDNEEREVWGGMRELAKQLSGIQLENAQAHALIGERIAKLETKMPNGEIAKMARLIGELVSDQDRRYDERPRDERTRIRPKGKHVKK